MLNHDIIDKKINLINLTHYQVLLKILKNYFENSKSVEKWRRKTIGLMKFYIFMIARLPK